MRKKVYFLAPKWKGWTYFYYKDISDYLITHHSDWYDVIFCNSFFDFIKLHFIKADAIFSIIPFLFKPIRAKKYIFNLHGNYKIERKNKSLWVKLLYLTPLNLWFSDRVMLTSYYIADKLWFREKYAHKISIVPNFTDEITWERNQQLLKNQFNFMTITSFKFYEKWKWIINLIRVIKRIGNKYPSQSITFSIVWNDETENFCKIKNEVESIFLPKNISIMWLWWLNKHEIKREFLRHNTFLYWSYLDNTPWVLLDAINYGLNVLTNNYESFHYFLDEDIICSSENEMVEKIWRTQKKPPIYSLQRAIKQIINNLE